MVEEDEAVTRHRHRTTLATINANPNTGVPVQREVARLMDGRREALGKSRAEYVRDLILADAAPPISKLTDVSFEDIHATVQRLLPESWAGGTFRAPDNRYLSQPEIYVRLDVNFETTIVARHEHVRHFSLLLRVISKEGGRAELQSAFPKVYPNLLARRQGRGVALDLEGVETKKSVFVMSARDIEVFARLLEYLSILAIKTKEEGREPL